MSHQQKHPTKRPSSSAFSRTTNSEDNASLRYRTQRKRRLHKKALVIAAISIVAVLAIGISAAFAYISDINHRLTKGIGSDLRGTLTEAKGGKPFYMLLLGVDKDESRANSTEYGASDGAYRSDSIMLVRVDPTNRKVALVSIHRDTLVDLGEHGRQKINTAFSIGGPAYTTEVIQEFAGVPISHYAEIDMDGMAAVVDAVGGIDVELPIDISDKKYTGLDLKAGKHHLDGKTATALCRARHAYDEYGDGDRYRAASQRIVISAVIKKTLKSDPATMTKTISELANMVTTDLDVTAIASLAAQMRGLDVSKDITSGMNPTIPKYVNSAWYEICDVEAWQEMMKRVDKGLSPVEDSATDTDVDPDAVVKLPDE